MGITPRTLTVQNISRLAGSAKAKMRLEQPATLVTVRFTTVANFINIVLIV